MRTRFTALGTALLIALGALATLTAADSLLARRAPIFCPDTTKPYAYYQPTVDSTHAVIGWYCTATEPVVYNGSSLSATATEINKLAGVTAGTTTASKALVVDSSKALDTLNIVAPRWGAGAGTALTLTAAEANALHGVTATATEINKLASVVAGTVSASKALVVDAASALNSFGVTGLFIKGGTGASGAAGTEAALTITKAVADASATDLFTVTIPHAVHGAGVEICGNGMLSDGDASDTECYLVAFSRLTGNVDAKAAIGTKYGSAAISGATANEVFTVTLSAVAGATSGAQTFTIKGTSTRSTGSATGIITATARLFNNKATGVTIAAS